MNTANAARESGSSWLELPREGTLVGRVPVDQVRFDESRRRLVDSEVFARLVE